MSNQTNNTKDDLRQQFRAALEANYPGTTANKQFLDHCMMFATQTKQETIQACKDELPEKERLIGGGGGGGTSGLAAATGGGGAYARKKPHPWLLYK